MMVGIWGTIHPRGLVEVTWKRWLSCSEEREPCGYGASGK